MESFGDLVNSYRFAAETLGYSTSYGEDRFLNDQIYILFFFWGTSVEAIESWYQKNCIVVNFEPMVPGTHAWTDSYRAVLKYFYVWEYSQSNFQRDRELGFRVADYVPLCHEPNAAPVVPPESVLADEQQDFDVVFFGMATRRRITVIEALMARGLKVAYNDLKAWSEEQRSDMLRRSKVALNMHNWDNSRVVEVHRLRLLLRHRKAVVCELYPDSEIAPELRQAVVGAPYDKLVDAVVALVADGPKRALLQENGQRLLGKSLQTDVLGPALKRFVQWRDQQKLTDDADTNECVSVCLFVKRVDSVLKQTIQSLGQSVHKLLEVIILLDPQSHKSGLELLAVQSRLKNVRIIQLPEGSDRITAWNLAIGLASGSYLVFGTPGNEETPDRLQRLASFLAARPEIDIVSSWLLPHIEGAESTRVPELDAEIKADLLGPNPLRLESCMLRKSFIDAFGLRFKPEFTTHAELEFMCNSVLAGARFAAIAKALFRPHGLEAPLRAMPGKLQVPYAVQARHGLICALFPNLTLTESQQIALLYADFWAPKLDFAEGLLEYLAKACKSTKGLFGTDREMLARVFRREATRMLQVFYNAKLIDQAWINQQFGNPAVAEFLSPIGEQLPIRPSNHL